MSAVLKSEFLSYFLFLMIVVRALPLFWCHTQMTTREWSVHFILYSFF